MESLKFNQLLVLSNSTKAGNQFAFPKRLTIITANDNNLGKSTLGKLLFWAMGCNPAFDTTWKNLDCRTLLRFSVGITNYEIVRYKSQIFLNENGQIKSYPKITGEFSVRIASILSFHALLPKKQGVELETPPPAYFFVPFYIDQKKSWSEAWNNFDNLQQYGNWKSTIIKYHIGLLTKEHFELELNKYIKKREESEAKEQIKRIDTTLEIVSQYIPENVTAINEERLNQITNEIRQDLKQLIDHQEKALDDLTKLETDKAFYFHQKTIAEQIILELDKDYKFSVENLIDDHIECPLCGTMHDNSIISRASILTDKQQADYQLLEIEKQLQTINSKFEKAQIDLNATRKSIEDIHKKYLIEDNSIAVTLNDIIENVAGNAIKYNVQKSKTEKLELTHSLLKEISEIEKQQKEILSKDDKDQINEKFNTAFTNYIEILNAEDINLSNINSPMDYAKIIKEGGAAEGVRGILAYYLAIYTLIESSSNDVIAPFLIDTPNQQEQSVNNYDKILEIITKKISSKAQIILCALNSSQLNAIKGEATIIHLNTDKLLDAKQYENIKAEFEKYKFEQIEKSNSEEGDDSDQTSILDNTVNTVDL